MNRVSSRLASEIPKSADVTTDGAKRIGLIATLPRSGTWFNNVFFCFYMQMLQGKTDLHLPAAGHNLALQDIDMGVNALFICHTICPGFRRYRGRYRQDWDQLEFRVSGFNWGEEPINDNIGFFDPALNQHIRIVYYYRNPLDQAGYTCKPIALNDLKRWHNLGERPEGFQPNLTFLESLQEGPYIGGSDCFFTPLFHAPVFRVVFIRRDLRQALASFRRMTKLPWSQIPGVLDAWMYVYEHFMTLPTVQCLVLDYDTEVLPLLPAVQRLADFLGLALSGKCLEETATLYNRNTMRSKLHARAAKALACLSDLQTRIRREFSPIEIHDFDQRKVFRIPREALDVTTQERFQRGQACRTIRVSLPDGRLLILSGNRDGRSFRLGPLVSHTTNGIEEEQAIDHFHLDHIASTKQHWSAAFTQEEYVQINRQLAAFLEKHGFER